MRAGSIGRAAAARLPIRLYAEPDFLIIGAQKAGTSSLYEWLTSHPDVLSARTKELHFFDRHRADDSIDAYWPNFPLRARMFILSRLRRRQVVTGEATPMYLVDPRIPGLVHSHLPSVKLIVILRDPVDRAVSQYWMELNRGNETLSLDGALRAECERIRGDKLALERGEPAPQAFRTGSYVLRGRYADQLENWLEYFSSSQILVVEFTDLCNQPAEVYRTALEFLGVDPQIAPLPAFKTVNAGAKQQPAEETLVWLREMFYSSNERLAELTGIDYN